MRKIRWHIGCSGFSYPEWKEIFYPRGLPQRKWFEFYAEHFSTLEINNTFYRFPQQKLFDNWYAKAPQPFLFSVKVPRIITHYKKFSGTQTLIDDFYAVATAGLKEKLGVVLFQCPPQLAYSEAQLEAIVTQLRPQWQNVVEFRHSSWWRREVFDALKKAGITFSGVSYPGLPDDAVASPPLAYYRFHGVPKLFYSEYSEAFIDRIADQLSKSRVKEAFIYFNNTASAAALNNARYLQTLAAVMSNE